MNLKLNEVFDDGIDGIGIFYYLQNLDVPWKALNINVTLDLAYHGNHGDRIIAPIVNKLLDDTDILSTANKQKLANVIFNVFKDKWTHEYALLLADYNPLYNYDLEEHETPAETTNTIRPSETTTTITPTETTETIRPAETTTNSKPAKTVTENGVSAFNSANYVSDTKTIIEGDNNDKGTESVTVNQAGTNKLEVDTAGTNKFEVDTEGSESITVQKERTLTRKGNIGVTTTQTLMRQELSFWQWSFYESVFKDIDSVLTLYIY